MEPPRLVFESNKIHGQLDSANVVKVLVLSLRTLKLSQKSVVFRKLELTRLRLLKLIYNIFDFFFE